MIRSLEKDGFFFWVFMKKKSIYPKSEMPPGKV
jgi:hypothetical protein